MLGKNTAQMEFLPRDKTRWLDERLCFGVLDNWPPSGWFSKLWAPKLECYLQNESNFYLIFGDSERLEINPTVSQSLPWTMGIPAVIGETFQTGHFDGISTELCQWTDLAVRSTILLCLLKKQHPIIHLLSLGSKTAMKGISLLYSSSPTCYQVHHIDFRCKTMLPRFGYSNMFGPQSFPTPLVQLAHFTWPFQSHPPFWREGRDEALHNKLVSWNFHPLKVGLFMVEICPKSPWWSGSWTCLN